ncbi:hypothetical protein PILCRDRAFT_84538 [Piloderma croceum F 1598]|uniref:Uncharacterized protein n=1 Tax=Piloderma croceum (strain F 1598) TaxID=765440 RepID=A0A0C3GG20_PILCF|nr:hypothetical protein PILCRDRAFT_84538 [Piloderma croceum F 1598]
MSFVPGADARAVDYANEYIFPSGQNILYQTVSAALSEGDEVDITFELKENEDMALEDERTTKAIFTDKTTGKKKVLWEVSNTSDGLGDAQIERAYNAYRKVLVAHLGVSPPPLLQDCGPTASAAGSLTPVSRALSPSNILQVSGGSWFFVELSAVPTSFPEYPTAFATLTRAFDALILTSMITLAFDSPPPLVFAIRSGMGRRKGE